MARYNARGCEDRIVKKTYPIVKKNFDDIKTRDEGEIKIFFLNDKILTHSG